MGKKDTGLMSKEVALGKATALCGGSEHCSSQIMEKLSLWNVSVQEDCLPRFKRYALNVMGVENKGTDEEIAEGMETIDEEDYIEALKDVLRAKDRTLKDKDKYLRKAKLVRHLLSKGFETELVIDAVDEYLSRNDL